MSQLSSARRARPPVRRHPLSIDVVILSLQAGQLTLLLRRSSSPGRERWEIPWQRLAHGEALDAAAARLARRTLSFAPAHIEQVGAPGDTRRHPGGVQVSVGYVALTPRSATSRRSAAEWVALTELPSLTPRHALLVEMAMRAVRERLDRSPIVFGLLPTTFTLAELQHACEVLLGRRLHKASFRRALKTSGIRDSGFGNRGQVFGGMVIEPTDGWRSEGRGRPARLHTRGSSARPARSG